MVLPEKNEVLELGTKNLWCELTISLIEQLRFLLQLHVRLRVPRSWRYNALHFSPRRYSNTYSAALVTSPT